MCMEIFEHFLVSTALCGIEVYDLLNEKLHAIIKTESVWSTISSDGRLLAGTKGPPGHILQMSLPDLEMMKNIVVGKNWIRHLSIPPSRHVVPWIQSNPGDCVISCSGVNSVCLVHLLDKESRQELEERLCMIRNEETLKIYSDFGVDISFGMKKTVKSMQLFRSVMKNKKEDKSPVEIELEEWTGVSIHFYKIESEEFLQLLFGVDEDEILNNVSKCIFYYCIFKKLKILDCMYLCCKKIESFLLRGTADIKEIASHYFEAKDRMENEEDDALVFCLWNVLKRKLDSILKKEKKEEEQEEEDIADEEDQEKEEKGEKREKMIEDKLGKSLFCRFRKVLPQLKKERECGFDLLEYFQPLQLTLEPQPVEDVVKWKSCCVLDHLIENSRKKKENETQSKMEEKKKQEKPNEAEEEESEKIGLRKLKSPPFDDTLLIHDDNEKIRSLDQELEKEKKLEQQEREVKEKEEVLDLEPPSDGVPGIPGNETEEELEILTNKDSIMEEESSCALEKEKEKKVVVDEVIHTPVGFKKYEFHHAPRSFAHRFKNITRELFYSNFPSKNYNISLKLEREEERVEKKDNLNEEENEVLFANLEILIFKSKFFYLIFKFPGKEREEILQERMLTISRDVFSNTYLLRKFVEFCYCDTITIKPGDIIHVDEEEMKYKVFEIECLTDLLEFSYKYFEEELKTYLILRIRRLTQEWIHSEDNEFLPYISHFVSDNPDIPQLLLSFWSGVKSKHNNGYREKRKKKPIKEESEDPEQEEDQRGDFHQGYLKYLMSAQLRKRKLKETLQHQTRQIQQLNEVIKRQSESLTSLLHSS